MLNPLIFRAYDIRGIAHKPKSNQQIDLTPEIAKLIGQGFGTYLIKIYDKKNPKIAVGRDARISGPELQKAFIHGLLETGCTVVDIGESTSPLVYYAVHKYNLDGGCNITASHNPKEYNGFKLLGREAHSICGEELQEVLKIIQSGKFVSDLGELETKDNVFDDYVEEIKSKIELKKKLKIVIDAGNGVAGLFAPELLEELGCEVIKLHCEPDGMFPNHEANPEDAKNLEELAKKVVEEKADLGIGFDGDGDRIGIIDENGKHYHSDVILIPIERDLLKYTPGANIVFDIKSSKILENDIVKQGGNPVRSRTGHSFIEKTMKDIGSPLAGETSGHMFFGKTYYNWYGFDDAIFAAAVILRILSEVAHPFSEFFKDLPKIFNTPEIKAHCPDDKKFKHIENIKEHFDSKYDCLTTDGVFVNFDKNSWGAIRCSNTTPCMTIRFEAPTENRLKEIQKIFFDHLSGYDDIDNSWYTNQ
ncbi:MAG: phosphomannomutase/phosphoglucomutase [Candidatus Gracilibacteria bacterium]